MERLTRTSDFGEAAFTFDLYINCLPSEAKKILNLATKLKEYEDLEETYHMSRKPLLVVRYDDNTLKSHSGHLGISVFLTESEAEAKLKELRGNNE